MHGVRYVRGSDDVILIENRRRFVLWNIHRDRSGARSQGFWRQTACSRERPALNIYTMHNCPRPPARLESGFRIAGFTGATSAGESHF